MEVISYQNLTGLYLNNIKVQCHKFKIIVVELRKCPCEPHWVKKIKTSP
jgi:hypothetical protein